MAFSLHNWVKFTNVREAKTTYSGVRKQISNIGHWSLRPQWRRRAASLCPKGGQVLSITDRESISIIHLITITTTTKTTTALYDIIIITKNNDNAHHHFGWWSSSKLLLMEEYIKY